MNKTIYLARHAKSAWDSGAPTDFARPLSNRGMDDAIRMGKQLSVLGWKPEKIIASPALRAQLTCMAYTESLELDSNHVIWNEDMYAAFMVTLLHILTSLPEAQKSVMLVGHNPAMEDLLIHLCGEQATDGYKQKNGKLFTTGNIAKITVNTAWKDLVMEDIERVDLVSLLRPKALKS